MWESMQPKTYEYDPAVFDFAAAVRSIYRTEDLSTLRPDAPMELLTWRTDQSTEFHAAFYREFEPRVRDLYRGFVKSFVPDVLGTDEFCFQRVPTFRIHFPGNVAVGEFHKDGDYHHAEGEVNFWLPLTRAWGTNSVWVEREQGSEDYAATELDVGRLLVFDAVGWNHGNKVNDTGSTRVSFDFRCIRLADYRASDLRTVDAGRGLWIGDYFDVF
ncbi:streptomycin biosynthesis protein StrG [Kitasatospora sp. NPDC057512]|uniref:streptomycin biosynthesis protein StrG n=1 Tax=Kitasatospora sp. NPDC057512 TaxID=3346154 RepID=UPI00369CD38F